MESLFQKTDVELQRVHVYFQQLEKCSDESQAQPVFQTIAQEMHKLGQDMENLDRLVGKEPPAKRRTARFNNSSLKYKKIVKQLQQDYNHLNSSVGSLQAKLTSKWRASAYREELLTRRFKPNETHLDFEGTELANNDRLHHSHNAIDDLIAQGSAVLDSLRYQHVNMIGVRRKIRSIGQTLGLSGTTLSMVEKRLKEDWILFLILCVVSLIFMYAFYRYWTG